MLSLVAATNVVPWMELLLAQTSSREVLAPSDIRLPIGTCVVSLVLLLGAWFAGRRNPPPAASVWIREPRREGLRFAVAAAAGNLALAGVVRWLGSRQPLALQAALPVFVGIWYLVILPAGLIAAFSLGLAGRMPRPRPDSDPL